jgi:nitroreductase
MNTTQALEKRYAVKAFDPTKKIPTATWQEIEKSIVLTPSSYGLQPWKAIIIQDTALREQLVPHSWNQRQIADCSHLVVFITKKALSIDDIDSLIHRIVEVRGGTADALTGYRSMMTGAQEKGYMNEDWAKKQAYIALGQLMLTAALHDVDDCPMEGFIPAEYDRILGLTDTGYTTAVLCPLGYRNDTDRYATLPKVRFSTEKLIEHR